MSAGVKRAWLLVLLALAPPAPAAAFDAGMRRADTGNFAAARAGAESRAEP